MTPSTRSRRLSVRGALARVIDSRWAWLLPTVAFLVVAFVWSAMDDRVLDWDSSRHFMNTFWMRTAFVNGDWLIPITADNANTYPPLVYLAGATGTALGEHWSFDHAVLAQDFVFVPLLAVSVWGAARIAYGSAAGVLAAVVALGSPMIIDLFHLYMLDAPQAACVAAAVWLVLASRRFERPGIAGLAGVASAAGMLVKPTTAIFLAGFLIAVLVRGGWRHWRGMLAFAVVGALVCLPWYVEHIDELRGLTEGATALVSGGGDAASTATYITPPRWSWANAGWYFWNLVNVQLLLVLALAFVAGTGAALARFLRDRRTDDPTPELLVGFLASYVGCTYLTLKDPRYSLPFLVFVAVLAVGWIPSLRGRARAFAAAVVVAGAVVNVAGVSFGLGNEVRLPPGGGAETALAERSVRVYRPAGYLTSAPRDDRDVLRMLRAAKAEGVEWIVVEPAEVFEWNVAGMRLLIDQAGLQTGDFFNLKSLPNDAAYMARRFVEPGMPEPCGTAGDEWALYLIRGGNALAPLDQADLWCPLERARG